MAQGASFIKIGRGFGFNRFDLTFWRFNEAMTEATLFFDNGDRASLIGFDCEQFHNWTRSVGEDAPVTHQATLFGKMES